MESVDSRVVVISGPSKGSIVRLTAGQLNVGREPSNHLCLADRAVSRKHFSITETDAGFHLVDLDSHNGTFVNGIPVRRKLLGHGDTIRVGQCELVFLITEDSCWFRAWCRLATRPYQIVEPRSAPKCYRRGHRVPTWGEWRAT